MNHFRSMITCSCKSNVWIDTEIRRMVHQKNRAFTKAQPWLPSKMSKCQPVFWKDYDTYIENIFSHDGRKIVHNLGHLWKGKHKMLLCLLFYTAVRMIFGVIHYINKHFQSVFTSQNISAMPSQTKSSYHTMSHDTINTSCVEKLLWKPNPHKATCPDAIPAHLLCYLLFGWDLLDHRRAKHRIDLFYKIINDVVSIPVHH